MKIQLSDHFTYQKLLRFVFPTIIMMIFTSIYGVIDGLFVSNFVGKTPFAALNLVMPFVMILGGIGFMIGTGGSALVAMELGCCFYCSLRLGAGRRGTCNRNRTMCRRPAASHLFFKAKFQPVPADYACFSSVCILLPVCRL